MPKTDKQNTDVLEKASRIPFPHDRFFKKTLSYVSIAQDFLKHNLPDKVLNIIDLSTLALEPITRINQAGKCRIQDVVYSVQLTDCDNQLFLFIEHQSALHPWMSVRVYTYTQYFMEECIKQGYKQLPNFFHCVFYHGETSPYPYSCHYYDLFKDREWGKRYFPVPFYLIDVTQTPDSELLNHGKASALELIQKNIYKEDIHLVFNQLKEHGYFKQLGAEFVDYIQFMIRYVVQTGNATNQQDLIQCLSEALPEQEENIMNIAQQFIQEGIQKGLKEGIQKGLKEGKQKGLKQGLKEGIQKGLKQGIKKIAIRMLESQMPIDQIAAYTGLSSQELNALLTDKNQ